MSAPETRLEQVLQHLTAKPDLQQNDESVILELDSVIDSLQRTRSRSLARAVVLRQGLLPYSDVNSKKDVLEIYKELVAANPADVEVHLEACRAFIAFEDADAATDLLDVALKLLDFATTLRAIELKPTKYQEKSVLRLSCVTQGGVAHESEPQSESGGIEYVPLHSDSQLDVPSFCSEEDKVKCTTRLSDLAYVALLLQAQISIIDRPLDQSSLVLPYIRRITESNDFSKLHWAVQERALYERSIHEVDNIEYLERGTVQLIKISNSVHASDADVASRLRYAHLLPALPWRRVDEMAARRLVAVSDFANAVPFYERLNQPLELVVCYSAIGDTQKALNALGAPELASDAKATMLRGDLEQDSAHWETAWSLGKLPEAKLRLAQKSAGAEDSASVQKHLDELLDVYPSNHQALYLSGINALGRQDWPRAAQLLRRSLAIDEDDPRSWSNLSTALLYLEQPEQALVALKQALRTDQNGEPDVKTLFNFVALSAQLANYDEVVTGLSQLCRLAEKGSAQYVARVASVLPRLVTHYVSQQFTNTGMQPRVVDLFRTELSNVIPEDDAMLARLTGKIEFWARRYWAGFAAYATAVAATAKTAQGGGGQREWMRAKLYASEYAEALEKYGDNEGRIEGSKACPDWKARLLDTQRLIEESTRALQQS